MLLEIIIGIVLVYYLIFKPLNYWKERQVPTGKVIPIVGENYLLVLGKDNYPEFSHRIYNKVPTGRYAGIYLFQKPALVLKSPELIKEVCIQNFNNVLDRQAISPDCPEPLMGKNLLSLKGQLWKNTRRFLSPSFTTSKVKQMHGLVCGNAQRMVNYYLDKNEEMVEVELKEVFTRFTNDAIANTVFGLEVNSFVDKDNEFYTLGKNVTDYSEPWKIFVVLMYSISSKLASFFNLNIYNRTISDFYINLVEETIKLREEKNIKRADIFGILLEARKALKKSEKNIEDKERSEETDENFTKESFSTTDMAAQLFLYMLAGYDTSSTTMSFMAYELAINPEIQKQLIQEIDDTRSKSGGMPSYEAIVEMKYMDMVISESLRKWPSLAITDRIVTTPFTIDPELPGEKQLFMNKGDELIIPIFGIHRDPKNYENPERFDPQRFSPENRKNINPSTYLPFGLGPRICIGMKLALLEVKVIFFHLLSHFEIVVTDKTEIPLKLKRTVITMTADNGFHVGFKRRNFENK